MTGADLALAALINRAAQTYTYSAPKYITYKEYSHIEGNGQSRDINRAVMVRVADDYAIMKDLPDGAERTGEAFPMIPFFDVFSNFSFCYYANLKKVDITFNPAPAFYVKLPDLDPSVDMVVAYFSAWAPRYAEDSTDNAGHFIVDPTRRLQANMLYPSDVREDPQSHLPSHVLEKQIGTDMEIGLDYGMVDGRWVITRGTFTATQRAIFITVKVNAVTTFSDFVFSDTPPDPRLAGQPSAHPPSTCPP